MTRVWFRVHSFTGVITGLLLFVICWSGTFAVLSNEFDWLVTPEARVESGGRVQSWGVLTEAVQAAYPDATIRGLSAPLYPASAAQVRINLPAQRLVWVYVDPSTAEVRGARSYFNLQRFFRSFHMNLFLPEVGLYLVSLFGVTMLVSLVAALVFYKRWWRRFFKLPRGRGRAFWSETHKLAGLWSVWFLLVIGVTGVWYLFEIARVDFGDGKVRFAGSGDFAVHSIPAATSDPALPLLPLDALVERAAELRPDLAIRHIFLTEDTAIFQGQAGYLLVRDRANQLHLDRRTGALLFEQTPNDYSLYWRWSDTADPLHFGDFGGLWSKGIWFIFGLLLSGLILTGTWLHAHRLAREAGNRARHRWPGTAAALAVSLLVLAASVPFGLIEARGYGPLVGDGRQFPELAPGVAAVIAGWIALTLAILAAWAFLLWRPDVLQTAKARGAQSSPKDITAGAQPPRGRI
ncbi:PepSY-associated TM helix domain-containing protein [Algihabitans sp.]|uniref:PepSY-associated TM helix domain-containing protein n=1 Tax=Algihabitans sp. TaxID=2821514 RepID=UPI003BA8C30F